MLRVLGRRSKLCDGVSRRELMRVGGLTLFGALSAPLARLAAAASAGQSRRRAKAVIFFNLMGGPSQQDTFDMKPNAPAEIRGEFSGIHTSLPGLQICEHLPNTSKWMHKTALIRTVTHTFNGHDPLPITTGYGREPSQGKPSDDPPDLGAICEYAGLHDGNLPAAVCLPGPPGWGESRRRPGIGGGFLGHRYDPVFSRAEQRFDREPTHIHDPVMPLGEPYILGLDQTPKITLDRLNRRRSLLTQLDGEFRQITTSARMEKLVHDWDRAFSFLSANHIRTAFDLSAESDSTRDRYGRNLYGSSVLVAKRLVEAGVTFVSVHTEIFGRVTETWDTHKNNFPLLKDKALPVLDHAFPALMQDLDDSGLLESTLVIAMGEMGRTAKVNDKGGRDHWPQCGFSLLAGAGVQPGMIHGATDAHATWPIRDSVSPADIVATIYELLGLDPHMTVLDRTGRPFPVAHGGSPIRGILV